MSNFKTSIITIHVHTLCINIYSCPAVGDKPGTTPVTDPSQTEVEPNVPLSLRISRYVNTQTGKKPVIILTTHKSLFVSLYKPTILFYIQLNKIFYY